MKKIDGLIVPVLRHPAGFVLMTTDCEKHVGKSMTVPDDSYTIRDLLRKFTQGIDLGINRQVVYGEQDAEFDDEDLEKVRQSDIFDREVVVTKAKRKVSEAKAELEREREERKRKVDPVVPVVSAPPGGEPTQVRPPLVKADSSTKQKATLGAQGEKFGS